MLRGENKSDILIKRFPAVVCVCYGSVVTKEKKKKLNATSNCIRTPEGTEQLFKGKEFKFPAAANSHETKKSIQCI